MDTSPGSEDDAARLFAEAVAIMARLRRPGGCPWDREQSFDSIQPYTLEETYEVLDAIDRRHWPDLCEELGDLLLQVLFYAEMAEEEGYFSIADVLSGLNAKLVRRHPHVFGAAAQAAAPHSGPPAHSAAVDPNVQPPAAITSDQVLRNWEVIKQEEKRLRPEAALAGAAASRGALDDVLRSLPALLEARKLGSRAHRVGFDWPDIKGLFEKLAEETAELQDALRDASDERRASEEASLIHGEAQGAPSDPLTVSGVALPDAVAAEVGDLLFTMANLARHLKVDPEFALRHSNAKFRRRFKAMERTSAVPLKNLSPAALEALWEQAKMREQATPDQAPPDWASQGQAIAQAEPKLRKELKPHAEMGVAAEPRTGSS